MENKDSDPDWLRLRKLPPSCNVVSQTIRSFFPNADIDKINYLLRNESLKDLGYRSYKDYLLSQDWRVIRSCILRDCPQCTLCGKSAEVVHHVEYDPATLLGLRKHALIALCHKCHENLEFDDKQKNSLERANRKLFELLDLTESSRKWKMSYLEALEVEKLDGTRVRIKEMVFKIAEQNFMETQEERAKPIDNFRAYIRKIASTR